MMSFLGILGAAALFALLGFMASRSGSRLEADKGCQGDACDITFPNRDGSCAGCGEEKSATGWWPSNSVTYGDRR